MKRLLAVITPLVLAGCGSTVHLKLNSNDQAAPLAAVRAPTTALFVPTATKTDTDLTTVQSVKVTVKEIDAHFSKDDGNEHEDSSKISDSEAGWQVVTTTPQTLDLMKIRGIDSLPLGTVDTSGGKLDQVRLKLKVDQPAANGEDVIFGAVVDSTGATCDLAVPDSATNPGIKIEGLYEAAKVQGVVTVELDLKLSNSSKDPSTTTCLYHLNPVIEIEKVEAGDTSHAQMPDGGA